MHNDDESQFRDALRDRIVRYTDQEARLAESLSEIQQALEDVRKRRRSAEVLYRSEFGDDPLLPDAELTETPEGNERAHPAMRPGPLYGEPWSDAIVSVLADAAEPLHVREIWQRMREGGFTSSAQDPLRSIVAVVLRTPGVVRAAPNTYTLAGGEA